jgi:hypothetical protein
VQRVIIVVLIKIHLLGPNSVALIKINFLAPNSQTETTNAATLFVLAQFINQLPWGQNCGIGENN